MARCKCRSDICGCDIRPGAGIRMSGAGTPSSPLYVEAVPTSLAVQDTPTLDLSVTGVGDEQTPYVLSGAARVRFRDIVDLQHAPADPYPPDKVLGVDHAGRIAFVDPTTVAPGAVHTGPGLVGDGSTQSPIAPSPSGQWGQGALADYGPDTTRGMPVYVDSAGTLRAQPFPKTYRQLRALVSSLPS